MREILSTLNTGHKKNYVKFVSRGNLNYMLQRMDIGLLDGCKEYPDRIYLKIGKIKHKDGEFRSDKEQAQGYYITSPEIIKELREQLLKYEIKLRKRQVRYNFEYHMHEDLKACVNIHKGLIKDGTV